MKSMTGYGRATAALGSRTLTVQVSSVNRKTLAFYEVLAAYKGAVMNIGTSNGLAIRQTNHQDALQCWITAVGHSLMDQMARVMREEETMA